MSSIHSRNRGAAAVCLMAALACGGPPPSTDPLERHLSSGADALAGYPQAQADAFEVFRAAVADSASRDPRLAAEMAALPEARPLAARLLRRYVVARYGRRMVEDLREMVGFRTVHLDGVDNWDAPEFVRQRGWLEGRARRLGLEFRSIDGRVEEVVLSGGPRTIGILTHGDVQGVEGQHWSSPPWEGRLVDGRIVGRGTEDDKGSIVTALYVLAALRDTGWPIGSELRLMIANGEECCWEEIPYYLERVRPPDVTLGFDAAYPVTHAQKAWSVLSLLGPPLEARGADADGGWRVLALGGGSGLSIIPEEGWALLAPPAGEDDPVATLGARARTWATAHPPARLSVERRDSGIAVTAFGRGGHSSTPSVGHNAFGDLVLFLAELPRAADGWSTLVDAVAGVVGRETDGRSLGVAHTDAVMGPLTASLALFDVHEGRPRAQINLRVPRGIETETIERRVALALEPYGVDHALYMPAPPHFVDPDGPLVRRLLAVWEEVTGEPGEPVAIGGGTQARLFPDGVDFGPALAMATYRGHGPDEYVTAAELHRNAELTIAALWSLLEP